MTLGLIKELFILILDFPIQCMFELTYISHSMIDDANPKDPREKPVPPRPKGQRPEPETTGGSTFGGFGGFGGGKT